VLPRVHCEVAPLRGSPPKLLPNAFLSLPPQPPSLWEWTRAMRAPVCVCVGGGWVGVPARTCKHANACMLGDVIAHVSMPMRVYECVYVWLCVCVCVCARRRRMRARVCLRACRRTRDHARVTSACRWAWALVRASACYECVQMAVGIGAGVCVCSAAAASTAALLCLRRECVPASAGRGTGARVCGGKGVCVSCMRACVGWWLWSQIVYPKTSPSWER
jgi:hypothetical protein